MELIPYTDARLRQIATPVTDITKDVVVLADELIDLLWSMPRAAAVAANQIGSDLALFVYVDEQGQPRTVLNPTVVASVGVWSFTEGCLSLKNLYLDIERPKQVVMTGLDIDGDSLIQSADEFIARVWQHEVDHLNGITFIERLPEDDPQQKVVAKWLAQKKSEISQI